MKRLVSKNDQWQLVSTSAWKMIAAPSLGSRRLSKILNGPHKKTLREQSVAEGRFYWLKNFAVPLHYSSGPVQAGPCRAGIFWLMIG